MAKGKKISFDDLFDPGLKDEVIRVLSEMKKGFEAVHGDAGKNAEELNTNLEDTIGLSEDLIRLQKNEIRLRNEMEQLSKRKGKLSAEEEARLTQLKQRRQANNRELNTEARLTNNVNDSMVRLSQALAKQKLEYRQLTAAERENKKIGGQLLKQIKQKDAEIKKLDARIGDHQRNVGNYTGAISGLGGQFGLLGTAMHQLKAGFNVIKLGFASVRAAFISTGIGALVIAVISLVQWFKSTAAGAARLREIMVPLNAIWNTAVQTIQNLGQALSNLFSQPLAETWNDVKGVLTEVNELYKDQIVYANNLATLENQQHKVTTKNIVEKAKLEREIAALRLKANDDVNVSLEEQNAAIQRSMDLTKELYDLKIVDAQFALSIARAKSVQSTDNEEAERALAEAEADLIRLEGERDLQLKTLGRRANTVYNKMQAGVKDLTDAELLAMEQAAERDLEQELANELKQDYTDIVNENASAVRDLNEATEENNRIESERKAIQEANQRLMNAGFDLALSVMDKQSAAGKLFATAQATINTYLAATQALADPTPLPYPVKVANAVAAVLFGLQQVARINEVKFAEGSDYVDDRRAPLGRDTIDAKVDRGEMILTRDEGARVRALGLGHSDVPGFAAVGKSFSTLAPGLIRIGAEQLSEQRKTNKKLSGFRWIDKDGAIHDLDGNKLKFS